MAELFLAEARRGRDPYTMSGGELWKEDSGHRVAFEMVEEVRIVDSEEMGRS